MKVLIAEDDPTSALLLENILKKQHYEVTSVRNGEEAWHMLHIAEFDVLITDWMMPRMDGIALIRQLRQENRPLPVILLITSTTMPQAREHALESGADDFLNKPYMPEQVINAIQHCIAKREQSNEANPVFSEPIKHINPKTLPPIACVGVTANTGGPTALNRLFSELPHTEQSAFLVILQVPVWALDMFAMRLQKLTSMRVTLADDGMIVTGGNIYIARKDRHLQVEPGSLRLRLTDEAEQNFSRPSADVLFKSIAEAFRSQAIALALTGIGHDGISGAAQILEDGGTVIVQDPASAEAPFLPQIIIDRQLASQVTPLPELANALTDTIQSVLK